MVPLAARPVVGRSEFTKSLGVTDRRIARDLASRQIAAWKDQVNAALAGAESVTNKPTALPTTAALEEAAVLIGYEIAGERVEALVRAKARLGEAAYDALKDKFEAWHKKSVREIQAGDFSYWQDHARRAFEKRGWPVVEASHDFATFVQALAIAGRDVFAKAVARMEGVEDRHMPSEFVQKVSIRRAARAEPGESLTELFERYAVQRLAEKRKRADTVNQDRKIIEQFATFVGVNRSVRSIERTDIRKWRDTVAALPPNYRKTKRYEGLSATETAAEARAAGVKGLAPNTVNKYLSTISPLFDWMVTEAYLDANPCDGLFYDGKKGANPRPPFSVEQLNKIFSSPLFTGFLRDGREHQPGSVRAVDWRFWIPLICLFTGARIGEIAQLRVEDIKQECGIWFLHIREDEEADQKTKSRHSRPVPVHSVLQEFGFLDFVEQEKARANNDGNHQLFACLKPNSRGQISGTPSRFWRNYLQAIGVKNGGDGFGAHSFRHTLTDQLRSAGYLDEQIAVVLGHSVKTVTSGYGRLRQGTVKMMSEMIETVRFDGVTLDHLHRATPYAPRRLLKGPHSAFVSICGQA